MALFNKLFTTKPCKIINTKYQDSSEKLFAFNSDQVRLILFRECDFRGRKLLFDSNSIEKIDGNKGNCQKFTETCNGFSYVYTKQQKDFNQLSEMVFGSVAMSFRGTYSKIHNLAAPARLMFSQVFPSPCKNRPANTSSQSLYEHSNAKLDDSGTSENSSINSDTVLICKELNVPRFPKNTSNSIMGADSGYENSSVWNSTATSFLSLNSGSFSKHWLRRHSLDQSSSLDEYPKSHNRSKLGLVLIVELTQGQEEFMSRFLMEHVTLLETLLWRIRHATEMAYLKAGNFVMSMLNLTIVSKDYLVNLLLSGSSSLISSTHFWFSSINGCDNLNSIRAFSAASNKTVTSLFDNTKKLSYSFNQIDSLFSLGKFFKSELDLFNSKSCLKTEDKFLREFCELLEIIDVKATNFFMSTLVTAVLTHHLGWVGTCLSTTPTNNPINPLWGQLSDLYGSIGHPTKMAQTILTGTNKKDLISKILNSLTYFLRCCDVERLNIIRKDVNEENRLVETICYQNGWIPKENYKKYEDHLNEIMNNNFFTNNEHTNLLKLSKNRTCHNNLSQLSEKIPSTSSLVEDDCVKVIFILGDDDKLVDLKTAPPKQRPTFLDLGDFNDSDFTVIEDQSLIKPSTSWSDQDIATYPTSLHNQKYNRSQSVPPEDRKLEDDKQEIKSKYRYSGVKFTLQQYPQILSNYMKSKNLEMSNLQFGEKDIKFDMEITTNCIKFESDYDDNVEALQTPSNASEELEFTSDLHVQTPPIQHAKEANVETQQQQHNFVKRHTPNTVIKEMTKRNRRMKTITLPMPKSTINKNNEENVCYMSSLIRSLNKDYCPDLVLQATSKPRQEWEMKLKNDLILASQHPLIDQPIEEAIAIIANVDTWEVQLMSSHTYVVDKSTNGIRVGMSQLVADMLESLLHLWKLNVPTHYCLMHLEQMLQELCLRSKALAQLLLASEFCSMELLTSTLHLEVNDVPLLLAVASTHSPQITQKYGLSFQ